MHELLLLLLLLGPEHESARTQRCPGTKCEETYCFLRVIIIIIIIFLLRNRVFEALRMHENSWKLVCTSEVAKIAMFCSDWAWASPAGSIAPPNAWKAIVWTKLILYSWNLVCTSCSLFQTYSSLGFISSAHPEVGHLEFCAFFMYFLHTLTNSSWRLHLIRVKFGWYNPQTNVTLNCEGIFDRSNGDVIGHVRRRHFVTL